MWRTEDGKSRHGEWESGESFDEREIWKTDREGRKDRSPTSEVMREANILSWNPASASGWWGRICQLAGEVAQSSWAVGTPP